MGYHLSASEWSSEGVTPWSHLAGDESEDQRGQQSRQNHGLPVTSTPNPQNLWIRLVTWQREIRAAGGMKVTHQPTLRWGRVLAYRGSHRITG